VAGDFASAAEQDHRWNCADVVTGREVLFGVGIDLGETQPRLQRLGRALEHRSHGAAGSAPGGPEVDQKRQLGGGMALEMRGVESDRRAGKQRLMAAAAFAALSLPLGRNAIEGMAMRTGNGDGG